MASGVARAGGVLNSTGTRRTATISAAQKEKITTAKNNLSANTLAGAKEAVNNATGGSTGQQQSAADVAGSRLVTNSKKDILGDAEMLQEEETRYAEKEAHAENNAKNNLIRHEIQKREEEINRIPKEFSYKKPAGGLGFYFVLLFMVAKDVLAIIIKIIELIGDVTIILGIIVWVIATAVDFLAFAASQLFFFLNGIPMNGKKSKIQAMGFIIEMVPILGFLPTESIAFVWVGIEANKEAKQRALDDMNERIELLKEQILSLQNEIGNAPRE